jgi:transposase InsO family protein
MTYIPTSAGWLYLAVVLDLFSRRIVGWSMGEAITAELACHALDMAWYSRSPAPGLIFHSDRGCQYASHAYTDLLASHGMKASMCRKGNCWDDACPETLFGSLKVERLHGMEFKNHREAKDATLDWLLWYNGSRMHLTLCYLSPTQFEQQAIAPPRA